MWYADHFWQMNFDIHRKITDEDKTSCLKAKKCKDVIRHFESVQLKMEVAKGIAFSYPPSPWIQSALLSASSSIICSRKSRQDVKTRKHCPIPEYYRPTPLPLSMNHLSYPKGMPRDGHVAKAWLFWFVWSYPNFHRHPLLPIPSELDTNWIKTMETFELKNLISTYIHKKLLLFAAL